MNKKVIVITGAAGFLGSLITVSLSRDYQVIALDLRTPGEALKQATPLVKWEQLDIARSSEVRERFQRIKAEYGKIDYILHFAAFCNFGKKWRAEFEETNIRGTSNITTAAKDAGASRLIFASSISVMDPPPQGQELTEDSPTSSYIPYVHSKARGEKIVAGNKNNVPVIILRIGGVFSDWCELPPLYCVIRMWSGRGLASRIIPGRGKSGLPYIHRREVIQIVRRCLKLEEQLEPIEIFLVSPPGYVSHRELFTLVRKAGTKILSPRPIYLPLIPVRLGLFFRLAISGLAGRVVYEKPWMLKYIDRPWAVDTSKSREMLGWNYSTDLSISARLPVILQNYAQDPDIWLKRNLKRIKGDYIYS